MHRLLFSLALLLLPSLSQAISVDFEAFNDGDLVTNQIPDMEFANTVALEAGLSLNELEFPPHSGTRVVTDDGGPIEILFDEIAESFQAYFTYVVPLSLTAFDALNNIVDTAVSAFSENYISSGNSPNELLGLSASNISRVIIQGDSFGGSFTMDDLSVTYAPTTTPMPLPGTGVLFALGLLPLFAAMRRRLSGFSTRKLSLALLVLVLGTFGMAQSASALQGFQSISADPPNVVKNTPTTVTIAAQPFDDPKLMPASIRLHRFDGSRWVSAASMVDNGDNGDATAGDGVFTAQVIVDEPDGTVSYRASAGYRGSFRRVQSSTAVVTLVDQISLDLDTGVQQVQMTVGDTTNLAYFLQIGNDTGANVTATVAEVVTPPSGLSVTSDSQGTYDTGATNTFNFNQVLAAQSPGSYQIQVDAEIPSAALTDSVTVEVTVLPDELQAELLPLGAFPAAIEIGDTGDVLFTVSVVGSDGLVVNSMNLELVDETGSTLFEDLGPLNDAGADGDLSADDFVFSGTATITGDTGGLLYFRATADIAGLGSVASQVFSMEITPFPVGIEPPLPGHVITDPDGNEMLDNELLVSFVEGVTDSEIVDIAASIGGTVVGTIPGAGTYQVRFPGDGTFEGLFDAALTLIGDGRVESVEPIVFGGTDTFPNDPSLGSQWGMEKIRADEAWLIARGTTTIAVVDSGIDAGHEDLSSKVVKGHDYVEDDDDPNDEHGHGTHVAGIAAASSDNNKGVAGVSWGSSILAIRIADENGSLSTANLAEGIREAADKGAKVINVSAGTNSRGGFFGIKGALETAVDYAHTKGALIVGSAGNGGGTNKRYPGAYDNAMAIGSTTSSDGRSSFSRHGSWVTMAAPGSAIYSTRPTYTVNGTSDLNYGNASGTSMSTPHVSGAAALLWSIHPTWTPSQIRQRLVDSAKELAAGSDLGAGRLDLFEAIFNGDFEMGSLAEWNVTGTASVVSNLGPLSPPNGEAFAFVSTGPAGDNVQTTLSQSFTVQPGVTSLPIRFDYNFVTEEYPEFVGSVFDDSVEIVVVAPDGTTTTLAMESVNGSTYSAIGGIDFPGGDDTVGETGWKKAQAVISTSSGPGTYRVFITDAGDDVYDSVVLIDHIELK